MTSQLEDINDLRSWLALIDELRRAPPHRRRPLGRGNRRRVASELQAHLAAGAAVRRHRGLPDGSARADAPAWRNARRLGMTLRLGTDLDDRGAGRRAAQPPERVGRQRGRIPGPDGRPPDRSCENVLKGRRRRPAGLPGTAVARGGRRPVHRHRLRGVHHRPGHRRAQRGRLPDAGAERRPRGERQHRGGQARRRARRATGSPAEGRAPVTASLGHDPLLLVVAGTEVPTGVCRARVRRSGASGRPIDVIRGEVTGLPIPANAARSPSRAGCIPDRREPEGPFGEWTGYYSGGTEADPDDGHRADLSPQRPDPARRAPRQAAARLLLHAQRDEVGDDPRRACRPRVCRAWRACGRTRSAVAGNCSPWPCTSSTPGHARQAGYLTSQLPSAAYMNKFVVVVDARRRRRAASTT